MRVFEELSKIQQPELIHPSDKKYSEELEKRQQVAQKQGCFVNPLFFQARITRISSYTIRAVQNAIIMGTSFLSFMSSLVARLVSRTPPIGEHTDGQGKDCEHYGKSIKRDVLESEFETLLRQLTTSAGLFKPGQCHV